jgi:hypothetical protein
MRRTRAFSHTADAAHPSSDVTLDTPINRHLRGLCLSLERTI